RRCSVARPVLWVRAREQEVGLVPLREEDIVERLEWGLELLLHVQRRVRALDDPPPPVRLVHDGVAGVDDLEALAAERPAVDFDVRKALQAPSAGVEQ